MKRAKIISNYQVAAALVCWAIFTAVAVLMVNDQTASWDRWALLAFRDPASLELGGPVGLADAARIVTVLGGYLVRNLVVILAVVVLAATQRRQQAVLLFLTIATGWILELSLKDIFARPRPDAMLHLVRVDSTSFPSGHAFNAAVVFLSIGLTFASRTATFWWRCAILALAFGMSLLVGLTRVVLGVHFPTDVIAGLAGGAGWVFLLFGLCRHGSLILKGPRRK